MCVNGLVNEADVSICALTNIDKFEDTCTKNCYSGATKLKSLYHTKSSVIDFDNVSTKMKMKMWIYCLQGEREK